MLPIKRKELIQVVEFIQIGKFSDGQNLLEELKDSNKRFSTEQKWQMKLFQSIIQIREGDFKKGAKTAKSVFKAAQKKDNLLYSVGAINNILSAYEAIDDTGSLQEWIKVGEPLIEKLQNENEELETASLEAFFLTMKAMFLSKSNDTQKAKKTIEEAFVLLTDSEDEITKSELYCKAASISQKQGELNKALEYYQKALSFWESKQNPFAIAVLKSNLASILAIQGDIHLALETFNSELSIVRKLKNKGVQATYHLNLGIIYLEMNDLSQALNHFKDALKTTKAIGNNRKVAESLFMHIIVYLRYENLKKATQFLNKLVALSSKKKDELINQWRWIGEAIVLSKSTKYLELGKAEELLEKVLSTKEIDQKITILALLHLSKLQLSFLQKVKDKDTLKQIDKHLKTLLKIADQQDSYLVYIETYIVQAQVALLQEDLQQAKTILSQAKNMASLKELDRLAHEIIFIEDVIKTKLALWERLLMYNPALIDLLELPPYEASLKTIIQNRMTQKVPVQDEDPILLIIQDPGGTSMYSKKFLPNSEFDEQLISAFLFAINNFMQETFAGKGSIDRITYLDYTLLFKPMEPFLICYAYRGQSYTSHLNLDRFIGELANSPTVWSSLMEYTETGVVPKMEQYLQLEQLVSDIFASKGEIFTEPLKQA